VACRHRRLLLEALVVGRPPSDRLDHTICCQNRSHCRFRQRPVSSVLCDPGTLLILTSAGRRPVLAVDCCGVCCAAVVVSSYDRWCGLPSGGDSYGGRSKETGPRPLVWCGRRAARATPPPHDEGGRLRGRRRWNRLFSEIPELNPHTRHDRHRLIVLLTAMNREGSVNPGGVRHPNLRFLRSV